jgi:hypothetical protein
MGGVLEVSEKIHLDPLTLKLNNINYMISMPQF